MLVATDPLITQKFWIKWYHPPYTFFLSKCLQRKRKASPRTLHLVDHFLKQVLRRLVADIQYSITASDRRLHAFPVLHKRPHLHLIPFHFWPRRVTLLPCSRRHHLYLHMHIHFRYVTIQNINPCSKIINQSPLINQRGTILQDPTSVLDQCY